jgi:hypothetical protein
VSKYLEVLTPQNSQLLFINKQPQMAFGVQSIDRPALGCQRSSGRASSDAGRTDGCRGGKRRDRSKCPN